MSASFEPEISAKCPHHLQCKSASFANAGYTRVRFLLVTFLCAHKEKTLAPAGAKPKAGEYADN